MNVSAAQTFHLAEANAAITAARQLVRPRAELDSHYQQNGWMWERPRQGRREANASLFNQGEKLSWAHPSNGTEIKENRSRQINSRANDRV